MAVKPPPDWGERNNRIRSEALTELFEIGPEELPLKTNTPPRLVTVFAIQETVEAAMSENRTEPLSKIYRNAHARWRIGMSGRGREELVRVTKGPMGENGQDDLDMLS